mgnify:CR=1 FL=1
MLAVLWAAAVVWMWMCMWVWVREIVSSQDHQGAHVGGCGCAKSYQAKIIKVRMWVGVGARNVSP